MVGRPIRQSQPGSLASPRQGERVGVVDLGVLSCYPETSDAVAGDRRVRMEMALLVNVCGGDIGGVAAEGKAGQE